MGRGILIRSTEKLVFHNKIQQSGINITNSALLAGGAIGVLRKSLLLVLEKLQNLVLSCAIATSNPTHKQTKRQAKEREDWEREGG